MLKPEQAMQIAVKQYCDLHKIMMIHIPNEGKRSLGYGSLLKRMGLLAGVSDCYFPNPTSYRSAWIELKNYPNKPTPLQLQFMRKMREFGHFAEWTNDLDSAFAMITQLHAPA